MTFIDTHCHLTAPEFSPNLSETCHAAHMAGVHLHIVPSVSIEDMAAVKTLCQNHTACLPAYGIHPYNIPQSMDTALSTLESMLAEGTAVAIGEIGIDLYDTRDNFNQQKACFCAQLDMARRHNLPVLLHIRRAADYVIPLLRQYKIESGIVHAFSGSLEQAQQFIKLGFKIGVGGVVTYPAARKIRHIAATIPKTSIVLETDAPFLPPVWLKGQCNTPETLPDIANSVAKLRGISVKELADVTTENALAILGRTADIRVSARN